MKLKLTSSEFHTLHFLLQDIVVGIKPKGMEAIVLHGVLFGLYKKFYARAINVQKTYTVSITNEQACAFCMFFQNYPLENVSPFTVNLVHSINNSIQQKFAA